MYCSNCGDELIEGAKFCNKCGTTVVQEKKINEVDSSKNIKSNVKYSDVQKVQPNLLSAIIRAILFAIVSLGICIGFWVLINGGADIPLGLSIIIIGIICWYSLSIIVNECTLKYKGNCPYCEADLILQGEAADCPKCKKRIILKDNKFYKV